jgi:hypothetical protein
MVCEGRLHRIPEVDCFASGAKVCRCVSPYDGAFPSQSFVANTSAARALRATDP